MAYEDSDFLSPDDFANDAVAQRWQKQAIDAIDSGVDPVKVNKMLRAKLDGRGYDTSVVRAYTMSTKDGDDGKLDDAVKAVWDAPSKRTKSDYASAVIPQAIRDINSVQNSPAPFSNVESGVATAQAPKPLLDRIGEDIDTFKSGVKGLLSSDPYQVAPDDARRVIGTGEGFARRTAETVADLPAVASSVPGAALAMQAYDWFKGGPTTPEKYEQAVKNTVGIDENKMRFESPRSEFAALAGSDILTSLAPGVKGAEALGKASRAAKAAKDLDKTLDNLPKTGDMHFDAGTSAYKDLVAANEGPEVKLPQYGEKGQLDLNLPPQVEATAGIDDLFSGKTKDAADVEAAREAAGRATALPEAQRLAQQGLLPGVEPVPVGELPSQRSPLEQQMLENVAQRQGRLPDANAAPAAPPEPMQGSLLPEESPEQLSLGNLPPSERPLPPIPEAPRRPLLDDQITDIPGVSGTGMGRVEQAIQAKRASQNVMLSTTDNTRPDLSVWSKSSNIPVGVMVDFRAGKLTGEHVLSHLIDDPEGMFHNAPEAQEWAKSLHEAGSNLGGLDTKIVQFDPNDPVHQDVAKRTQDWDNAAAVYDPHTNRIYVNKDANMSTLVHEVGHAVRYKALDMGEKRLLPAKQQQAYDMLNHLYETFKPQLQDLAEKRAFDLNAIGAKETPIAADWRQRTYGLNNLHELMSEMDANQHFRNSLRELKISEPEQAKLGLSKTVFGRLRNAYDAIKTMVGKAMGISVNPSTPKNSLDALFAAREQFFRGLDGQSKEAIQLHNARNTEPNLGFLGESAPLRSETEPSAFARWFGKSVVKNADGSPKVLYHGTSKDKDFDRFNVNKRGAWLTEDPKEASNYAADNESRGPRFGPDGRIVDKHTADRVIPVHVRIERPYKITPEDHARMNVQNYARAQGQFFDELRAKGYDGVDMGNGNWVVLDKPNQIKSAIGNTGEYSDRPQIHRAESGGAEIGNDLRRKRGPREVAARELLHPSGGGNVPEAAEARRFVQGNVNAARQVATSFKNLAESQRGKVNIDHVNDVLTNTPNAKNAMTAIRQASPKLAEALNQMRQRKYDMGLKIADEVDRNPNATPEEKGVAAKIREKSLEWLPRVYARDKINGWTDRMLAAADKGDPDALSRYNAAKQYLANKLLPGADKLATMKGDELAEVYRAHMNLDPDKQFQGMKTEDKQNAMRAAITSRINDYGNVETFLDNATRAAAKLDKDDISAITTYFKNVKRGSNVLAQRTHAPEALRRLWGEVSDPLARMYYGIEEQASQYAQLKAQNDLRAEGLKNGLFSTQPGKNTVAITGESFGPLQGLHTNPDILTSLQSQRALSSHLSDVMQMAIGDMGGSATVNPLLAKAVKYGLAYPARGVKLANIIGNLGNFPNNFVGSFLQLASNGNVNPVAWAKGAKIMAEAIGSGMKKTTSPELERAFRNNLLEFSQTEELRNNPHSQALGKLLNDIAGSPNPLQTLKSAGKESWNLLHEFYGAQDLWSKLANFENEYALQKRWNPQMAEDLLEQMVARRINETNITPSRTPRLLKAAENVGATQYEPYYYQVAKTTVTNIGEGLKDVKAGFAEGNMEKALHGAARLAGTGLYLTKANAAFGAAIGGIMGIYGLATKMLSPNDPRKKLLDKDDYTSSIDPMLVSDPNNPQAGEFVQDISRPNPFGPISAPVNRLYQAAMLYPSDPKAAKEQAKIALDNIVDITIANPNSLWQQAWKAGKTALTTDASRPSIAKTAPETYNALHSYMTQTLGMEPQKADAALIAAGMFTPKTLKNYAAAREIPGETPLKGFMTSGTGLQKFDVGQEMTDFIGPQLKGAMNAARKPYMDLLKANYDISQESLDKQFSSHLKDLVDPYEKMKTAMQAARAQGLGDTEITIKLMNSGVGKEAAAMLLNDQPMPAVLLLGNPITALTDAIKKEDDPQKQDEMIKRLYKKVDQFTELMNKYQDITMDQVEAM